MELTIRTGRTDEGHRLPLLERLKNLLLGTPPSARVAGLVEDEKAIEAKREIDRLTPEGLANAVSDVLWAQRGSLRIDIGSEDHEYRGVHSPGRHQFTVTMPEGIVLRFDDKCKTMAIRAPDGEVERVDEASGARLVKVWRAIQAVSMCEALGLTMPAGQNGLRPAAALKTLNDGVCAIVERADPPRSNDTFEVNAGERHSSKHDWLKQPSAWKDLGGGVFLNQDDDYDSWYGQGTRPTWCRVMTTEMGALRLRREPLAEALERRKRSSFANALGLARALPIHLPMPSGNAQAARVLRLCREAVAREPNLMDAKGTAIAPLVEQHLPRLMQKHAEAARIAETSELAAIDADLMEGIERVRLAVEEALVVSRVDKREALRTELAFLEYRHPSPSALSLDAPENP